MPKSLRELRNGRLLTLKGLSEEAGVGYETLVSCENGHRFPSNATISKVRRTLSVSPEDVEEFKAAIQRRGRTYRNVA